MKTQVLMIGWELPPKISGGLGTACAGLLKGLRLVGQTEVTFVVPRLNGGETQGLADLVGVYPTGNQSHASSFINLLQKSSGCGDGLLEFATARYFEAQSSKDGATGGLPLKSVGGAYDLRMVSEVIQYAEQVKATLGTLQRPDLIHAHDWLTFPAAIEAKQVFQCPLVVHVHSTEFDRGGAKVNPEVMKIERAGLLAADKIITVSEVTRQTVIQRYGIAPENVVRIHNGIDVNAIQPNTGYSEGPLTISFIGRITHQKGPRHFIDAAKIVLAEHPGVRFVMAGGGDLLPMVKSLASVLGVRKHIEFPGFLDSQGVSSLLAQSHVYVMPSVAEPFGIGALEAMIAGVPTIVTDCCGVSEVVEDCMKIPSADASAIAEAISQCILNAESARQQATRAREVALKLTWDVAAKRVVQEYLKLLDIAMDRRRPDPFYSAA